MLPYHWHRLAVTTAGKSRVSARCPVRAEWPSFISHGWTDLASPRVAELRQQGAAILCWTIRSPEQEAEARKVAQNVTFEQYLA